VRNRLRTFRPSIVPRAHVAGRWTVQPDIRVTLREAVVARAVTVVDAIAKRF
jgi:hypothetical protein